MSVNKQRFWTVASIAFGLPVFFAIMDSIGYHMWKSLGGFGAEAYIIAEPLYMRLFWTFAYALIIIIPILYYVFRKDVSESLALFLIPFISLSFGLEDIFYYIFTQLPFFGTTMPWLWNTGFTGMRLVAELMGKSVVDSTSLLVSATIGVLLSVGIAIGLYRYKLKK